LPHQVRIPDEIFSELYKIRESLVDPQYISDAPTYQDMVNVAIKRLISDWQKLDARAHINEQLFEQRQIARSKMGRNKDNPESNVKP
jgi:hypothetical protein